MQSSKSFQIVLLISCIHVSLYNITNAQNNRSFFPTERTEILSEKSGPGFYYIRDDVDIDQEEIFETHRKTFGLGDDDEMVLIKSETDDLGYTHTKFRQYYKGLPVEVSMLIVHQNAKNKMYLVNGHIIHNLQLPSSPLVNESDALQIAMKTVPATKYLWQDEGFEMRKKVSDPDANATYFPKGKLCIYPMTRNEDLLTEDFSLGWEFDIYVLAGGNSTRVYVDALDGEVKNSYKLGTSCSAGSATTIYNGSQTISTKLNGANYNLINDCQATIMHTYDLIGDTTESQATEFNDVNNVWNATNQFSPAQTHFGMEQTYQYYKNAHSRFSWNGSSGPMNVYHGFDGLNYSDACWGCLPEAVIIGIGPTNSNLDDHNTLDLLGHEFTHGVFSDEVGGAYYAQHGALDESFADIFGEMVEQTTEGLNENTSPWLFAEDVGAFRSYKTPKIYAHPDTYQGQYWVPTDTCFVSGAPDNCGVHVNSGVQNHWFYLLAHGGMETNDNGDTFSVSGLGNVKARMIAYRNLVFYLPSTGKYLDARNGAVQAAEDLYGGCSNEAIQTAKAWYGVGGDKEHLAYNAFLNCFTVTSPSSDVYIQGIRSLRLSHTVCGFSTVTATNYDIYLLAGDHISMKHDSQYATTGTKAVVIAPWDCSFTIH